MLKTIVGKTICLFPKIAYSINALSLLEDKYERQNVKINPKLFPLYMHQLLHQPFNERFTVVMIMDSSRALQSEAQFDKIVEHSLRHMNLFKNRQSLVALLNQMYHYKYDNKQNIESVVRRVLAIQQPQGSGITIYNLKLIIAMDALVGLQHFEESLFRQIRFQKFKPLSLAIVLQLFYKRKLQDKLPLVQELVDMFVACESFIPFADLHHLNFSIRTIDNQKFKQCFYRVRRRIQTSLRGREDNLSDKLYGSLSEQQLFQRFQKNISDKYSTNH